MHIELVALILPRHSGKHQPINHDSFYQEPSSALFAFHQPTTLSAEYIDFYVPLRRERCKWRYTACKS